MEINTGATKQKVYRHTERRAEPAFHEIREQHYTLQIRCLYCLNIFYGPTRDDALRHQYDHVKRKHPEHVEATWKKAAEISSPLEAVVTLA